MVMIGPGMATIKIGGKKSPMMRLVVPKDIIDEAVAKGEPLEDRDRVRIWIEKTGAKTPARKNAFGKFNLEDPGDSK